MQCLRWRAPAACWRMPIKVRIIITMAQETGLLTMRSVPGLAKAHRMSSWHRNRPRRLFALSLSRSSSLPTHFLSHPVCRYSALVHLQYRRLSCTDKDQERKACCWGLISAGLDSCLVVSRSAVGLVVYVMDERRGKGRCSSIPSSSFHGTSRSARHCKKNHSW